MNNNPAPIQEPLDYRGNMRVTTPAWVLFFQKMVNTVTVISTGVNSYISTLAVSTVLDNNYYFIKAVGSITITLPNAIFFPGKQYVIKKLGAGNLTIALTAAQTIDGAASLTIDQPNVALTVESDGANWCII
jgi:hypothetical protein